MTLTKAIIYGIISCETVDDRRKGLSMLPVEDLQLFMMYLNDLYKDVRRAKADKS